MLLPLRVRLVGVHSLSTRHMVQSKYLALWGLWLLTIHLVWARRQLLHPWRVAFCKDLYLHHQLLILDDTDGQSLRQKGLSSSMRRRGFKSF